MNFTLCLLRHPTTARCTLLALLIGANPGHAQEGSADPLVPMIMPALTGPYEMMRESSGTSWQPDSTPMSGMYAERGGWSGMIDGFVDAIYDEQGGPRGAVDTFSTSMLMFMARRALEDGALGLRFMVSGDPLMGRDGYPLLFQTGETSNGVTPLIDRQHPHDLLMEAAASYSVNLSASSSLFLYGGLPGEPALGPPAFMHRASDDEDPAAPLSHHWLDSTHVSWGVLTLGYTLAAFKVEASAFNGHEPDQNHYSFQSGPLESYSARLSFNPTPDWALQVSSGHLVGPEQLQPGINVNRTTASMSYNAPVTLGWQTTFAYGHNAPSSGAATSAWLLESEARLTVRDTVFTRLERVGKDELFLPGNALYGEVFTVNALSVGYVRDFIETGALRLGLGGLVTGYSYPTALDPSYGSHPLSFMVFARARL
jgi:hypothetical protein